MKVLYLTNIPSPYRIDFFNELGKYCELTVAFERHSSIKRSFEWHSTNYVNFNAIFLKGIDFGADGGFCPSIYKWLDKRKFDVIIVGGYSTPTGIIAIAILKIRNIPFCLNSDGGMIKNDKFLLGLIKKILIGSATYWLSTGKMTNAYLLHYGAKVENIIIYPFTSLAKNEILILPKSSQEKITLRNDLGLKYDTLFLSIGQFIHRKGFDILIQAFQKLQDSKIGLVIIGGGEEREMYEAIIEKSQIRNIHLIDFKKKKDVLKYYDCSDIFVLPTREDIWGLVINEAMSRGLPVVSTTKCVAAVELVREDKNGYIVSAENEEELYDIINKFAYMKKEAIFEMGKNAIRFIQDYTIENMASTHIKTFYLISQKIK